MLPASLAPASRCQPRALRHRRRAAAHRSPGRPGLTRRPSDVQPGNVVPTRSHGADYRSRSISWVFALSKMSVTRSRTKFRRCRPCSPNSASPAPSSPLMPCTVKKTLELAAATDALMIAQVKDNQPTLHRRVEQACAARPPVDQHTTRDQNQHSRDETRLVEVFDPHNALADTEWAEHVGAIIRVSRTTHRRVTATGM